MVGELRVGVLGAGAMGSSHARTLAAAVPEARLTTVFDMNAIRASSLAGRIGAHVADSSSSLIEHSDAVVIASPDGTHASLVEECLAARKPVFCEKPLASTLDQARRIVDSEVSLGRRLVQMGFNRRFDPGFVRLKGHLAAGRLGQVRLVHAIHRNARNTTSVDDASLITGSMIHEFDTLRWLLDDEIASIRVESPIVEGFRDPQLATIVMSGGQLVTVEVFVNATYGYEVRVEVVGTAGTATLDPRTSVITRVGGEASATVGADGLSHFSESYLLELRAWVRAATCGTAAGATAWDGLASNVAADAGVRALRCGHRQRVDLPTRPQLYD